MQERSSRWGFTLCGVLACHPVQPAPRFEEMTAASPNVTDSSHTDSDSTLALYATVLARNAVDSALVSAENRRRESIDSLSERRPDRTLLAYALQCGRIVLQPLFRFRGLHHHHGTLRGILQRLLERTDGFDHRDQGEGDIAFRSAAPAHSKVIRANDFR